MELIVSTCSVDDGIRSWDLRSGSEQLHYRSCASPTHGLLSVSGRFFASSQLRENPTSSSPIFFWSLDKPQVQVRSFPAEPIGPLVSDFDGSYIFGGGSSGVIYIWEIASGKLLKKWNAHYRSVTCLTLSDDESFLISGSEDGSVRVWPLLVIFDDTTKGSGRNIYKYSFLEHSLRVTSVISGHGLCNSIIISSSEDHTCKVWSLSEGRLLRSIKFPFTVDAIALDPGEHIFYAGCRDGRIYIAALNAESDSVNNYGKHIIGSLSNQSKAITCLAFSTDGVTLVSGSEDGTITVWNTKSGQRDLLLKHAKGPISNILIVRQPISQVSLSRKHEHLLMGPPLDRYTESRDDEVESKAVKMLRQNPVDLNNNSCNAASVMVDQIKELQKNVSAGSAEMELERMRLECKRSMEMAQHWKKLYKDLQTTFVNEILNDTNLDGS